MGGERWGDEDKNLSKYEKSGIITTFRPRSPGNRSLPRNDATPAGVEKSTMNSISRQLTRLRPLVALILMLLYGTATVLMEVGHHDELGAPPGVVPSIAAHTCSGYEHHIPIDQWSSCPACIQSAQRVSVPASTAWFSGYTALAAVAVPVLPLPCLSRPLTLHPSKRGPPAV